MMKERPEILVVSPIRPRQMDQLAAEFTLHRLDRSSDPERFLADIAARITAIVTTGSAGALTALVDSLPNLQLIATSSVGVDKIDLDACRARGIIVANTPDVLTDDVADLAFGLVMTTQRRLIEADVWVRSGAWAEQGAFPLTTSLSDQRVGILGLGATGQAISCRCAAFRMHVAYCIRQRRQTSKLPYFSTPEALAA